MTTGRGPADDETSAVPPTGLSSDSSGTNDDPTPATQPAADRSEQIRQLVSLVLERDRELLDRLAD